MFSVCVCCVYARGWCCGCVVVCGFAVGVCCHGRVVVVVVGIGSVCSSGMVCAVLVCLVWFATHVLCC